MSRLSNLAWDYHVGGNLPVNSPTYVRRQADLDLYDKLKAGEFCYVLNSRQMGKSSLRVQIMHQLQAENIACAVVDLTTIGIEQVTLEQWYASSIASLVNSFKLKLNLSAWWRDRALLSPVQRLSEFLEQVLLVELNQNIVIFVDEIDSVLSLKFSVEDFFAVIRACYNQRAEKPAYNRLTFAMFGVATPADLMQDKTRTPFNIGQAIELRGFQLSEVEPLAQVMSAKVSNSQALLKAILDWTRGQPFLTQKLCKLVLTSAAAIPEGDEELWIQDLVRSQVIENWEAQDDPTHLKTIRDRILRNPQRASQLGLYQQILHQGEVAADDSSEQVELRLSGLVEQQATGKLTSPVLKVSNRIYAAIFNQHWVAQVLANLRPYAEAMNAWSASGNDESWLLRGQALRDAQAWAKDKSLTPQDYLFLDASWELESREFQNALEVEKKANQILKQAQQRAELALEAEQQANQRLKQTQWQIKQTIHVGFSVLALISVVAITVGLRSLLLMQQAEAEKKLAQIALTDAKSQLLLLKQDQLGALVASVKAGRQLRDVEASLDVEDELKHETVNTLQQVIYSIQEINRLEGHQDKVNTVSFSPDGQIIASASDDGTVRLWTPAGSLLKTLTGHSKAVNSFSFSPDSQIIASASDDNTIKLWHRNGSEIRTLKGHSQPVHSVSFSPDGEMIASGSWDNTIKLWHRNGQKIKTPSPLSHRGAVYSVSFSPDSQIIASTGQDGNVKLWNRNGSDRPGWKAHSDQINSVSFSPDGKAIASASNDGTIKLWKPDGTLLKILKGHSGWIYNVSFSPDRQTLASTGKDGTIKLWRLSDRSEIKTLQGRGRVYSASFSPDGQMIASASYNNTIQLWKLNNSLRQDLTGHRAEVNSVSFSPDSQTVVSASQDGTIKFWHRDGTFVKTFTADSNWFAAVSFSPDGKLVASANRNKAVKLWNRNGTLLKTLNGHRGPVYSVHFSPQGNILASGSYDRTIKLWNRNGELIQTLSGHVGRVYSVHFSPQGDTLASASYDRTIKLWNRKGELIQTLKGHNGRVYSVSFSPDGQVIASASQDGTIKLWNRSGSEIKTLQGHRGSVYSVSFSPQGKTIASASDDNTIKLWNFKGELLKTLSGHRAEVNSVSFSPDSKTLASASRDNTVILWNWNLTLDELLEQSCDWLDDYLKHNPNVEKSDRLICDGL